MKGAPLNTLINSGDTWRPCFSIIATDPRSRQKSLAPFSLLNVPEIFCFTFIMRRFCSVWLFVKGMIGIFHECRYLLSVVAAAIQEIFRLRLLPGTSWNPDFLPSPLQGSPDTVLQRQRSSPASGLSSFATSTAAFMSPGRLSGVLLP